MITLIDSFTIKTKLVRQEESSNCIFDSFSLGVLDKRYPKNDKVLLRFSSLKFTEESEFQEAKIIRVK